MISVRLQTFMLTFDVELYTAGGRRRGLLVKREET